MTCKTRGIGGHPLHLCGQDRIQCRMRGTRMTAQEPAGGRKARRGGKITGVAVQPMKVAAAADGGIAWITLEAKGRGAQIAHIHHRAAASARVAAMTTEMTLAAMADALSAEVKAKVGRNGRRRRKGAAAIDPTKMQPAVTQIRRGTIPKGTSGAGPAR